MNEQFSLRVTIVRGGTSKAILVRADDLPDVSPSERDALVRGLFGSPDRRQIDGLGGADLLTSKFAIIGPPTRPDADLDYTFAQVGIEVPTVAWDLNCGNISAAVGPYAIQEGMVEAVEPRTTVRIHNTNTQKIIVAEVPVRDGEVAVEGELEIDGVPGSGARVALDFSDSAGARTGRLLPTGNAVDLLDVPGLGALEASIVDAANPIVFVDAAALGLTGAEDPVEMDENKELMAQLERIRSAGAFAAGMASSVEAAFDECPTTPFVAVVGAPQDSRDFQTGAIRSGDSVDVVARLAVMRRMHKAYAGTGTICTGAAAAIPGTIVNRFARPSAVEAGLIRLGHPSGTIPVEVSVSTAGGEIALERAAIVRTARRLLDGTAYIRRAAIPAVEREPAIAR